LLGGKGGFPRAIKGVCGLPEKPQAKKKKAKKKKVGQGENRAGEATMSFLEKNGCREMGGGALLENSFFQFE
jgi:hypothetical protein